MMERGAPVTVAGRQYTMVLTNAALMEIIDKFGDLESLVSEMDRSSRAGLERTLWLAVQLINQGVMLDTGNTSPNNPDLMTVSKLALMTGPQDLVMLTEAATKAMELGMAVQWNKAAPANDEVDVVLEEIETEKNA